jgi:hypothetical protein
MAEGRAGDDEEDKNAAKGPDIVCKLSLQAVHNAIALRTTSAPFHEKSHVSQMVLQGSFLQGLAVKGPQKTSTDLYRLPVTMSRLQKTRVGLLFLTFMRICGYPPDFRISGNLHADTLLISGDLEFRISGYLDFPDFRISGIS